MGIGEPALTPSGEFPGIHSVPSGPDQPEVTMWNAEFKPGAIPTASLGAEFRPEPDPLSPKENLEAIVSILAVGVLRRRARKSGSSSDIRRKAENL